MLRVGYARAEQFARHVMLSSSRMLRMVATWMARVIRRTMMMRATRWSNVEDCVEEDSAYVHGRRLVLSVADEQTALDRCW